MRCSRTLVGHVLAIAMCLGPVGCGTGPASTTAAPTAATGTLNGNWLLTGTLPFIDPLNFGSGQSGFGIAMTFTTTGSQLVGGGTVQYPCGSFTVGGSGGVVNGTIAGDGSFTAQSASTLPLDSLVLKGTVPAAGASTWNGSYTFIPNNTSCPQSLTGSFTATRIADVTGTYVAKAPVALAPGSLGSVAQSVSLTFTFQQGVVLPGATASSPEALAGSVQIAGSTCFQTGTAAGTAGSGLLGNTLVTAFTLNDGSKMQLLGDTEDAAASRLVLRDLIFSGGACGTLASAPFEVVKQ